MRELIKIFIFFTVLVSVFFYPVFKGQIPFPGDLLLNFHEPYKAYPIMGFPPGGVPTKFQGADVIRELLPWKYFAIKSFEKGEIPLWDSHNFSGNPLMANFQTGIFYPINLLFLILPFLSAWTVYIMAAPILACFFMYLYLREIKLSKISSFFGGVIFAFSSYMVVWIEYGNISHTLMWFPLGLFFTEKLLKNFKLKYYLLLILALFLSFLAGYVQAYFYIISVLFIYFLLKAFFEKTFNFKIFSLFSLSLVLPISFSLFQLLPTLELLNFSSRGENTLSQIQHLLNPWWYAVTVVVPNFFGHPAAANFWFYGSYLERVSYIGLIPFVLFLYALFNFKKRKEIIIFGFLAVISFILSLDILGVKYFYKIPISILSTSVPTRILAIFEVSAIILSSIGLDIFIKRENKRKLYISLLLVFLVLAFSWFFALYLGKQLNFNPLNLNVTTRNLILPTIQILLLSIISFLYFRKKRRILLLAILFITFADLFYFFHKFTPFSPKEFVYPQAPVISYLLKNAGINRFWGYGSGYVDSNFQTFDQTYSPEGYDPLHIRSYTELLTAASDGRYHEALPKPDANVPPGFGKEYLRANRYRQKLLNLLGVKYVFNKSGDVFPDNETFSVGTYNFIYHDGYYQIYENKEAFPRIFLTYDYAVEKNERKVINLIYRSKIDLRKTLVLNEKPGISFRQDPRARINLVSYSDNKVEISSSSSENQLLFISDNYYPGWKARIDGKDAKIYLADATFRAVAVPKGEHKIIFSYEPKSFINGLRLSLISFAIFLGFLILQRKKNVQR